MHTLLESAERGTSGTAYVSLPSGAFDFDACHWATFWLDVTAHTGATPTLNVYIQQMIAENVAADFVAFAQATAAPFSQTARWSAFAEPYTLAAVTDGAMSGGVLQGPQLGGRLRIRWDITGGTLTFAVRGRWWPLQ